MAQPDSSAIRFSQRNSCNTAYVETYVSGTKYITEIALLNSNKETMVMGKFSAPRARITSVDVFSVKLDF